MTGIADPYHLLVKGNRIMRRMPPSSHWKENPQESASPALSSLPKCIGARNPAEFRYVKRFVVSLTERMTHEEYVAMQRRRVAELVRQILDGDIDVLDGAYKIASLRWEVEDWDQDFKAFALVSSETDHCRSATRP